MATIMITGWEENDGGSVDFGAVKKVDALRKDAEGGIVRLIKVSERAAPVTDAERRQIAADCRYNAYFGSRKMRSKVCRGGDCLHTAYIARREKEAASGDAAVAESTAALKIKLSGLVDAAGLDNVRIFDVPRKWRDKIDDILNPPPPPMERRVDEMLSAIDAAAADGRQSSETAEVVASTEAAAVDEDAADAPDATAVDSGLVAVDVAAAVDSDLAAMGAAAD